MSKGSGASAKGGGGGAAALESLGATEITDNNAMLAADDFAAQERSERLKESLSYFEARAFDYYTEEGYKDIRKALTGEKGASDRAIQDAMSISDVLRRESKKQSREVDVFRGMAVSEKDLKRVMRTKNIHLDTITSTTRSPTVAKEFIKSNHSNAREYGVLLKIRQKSGVSIDTISAIGTGEREVLLRHGTKLKVERMQKTTVEHGGTTIKTLVIHAREV